MPCSHHLEAAKEQLSIPALWQLLNLPGKPARSCRSPFREDRNPSFSIYDEGCKWKDHATGEGGDAVDFVAVAFGISNEEACRKLIELPGVIPQVPHFPWGERESDDAKRSFRLERQFHHFKLLRITALMLRSTKRSRDWQR
jgi:hypothetical protein